MFETASNLQIINSGKNCSIEDTSTTSDNSNHFELEASISNIMKGSLKKNRGSSFILTFDYLNETTSAQWLSKKKGIQYQHSMFIY